MKANELMIGDWVNLSPGDYPVRNYVKIHAIDYDYKVGKNYVCDIAFLSTGAIQYNSSMRVLKPIQLTPGILEKNGFSYPKQSAWMKLDCPARQLWGCLHTDGAFWLYASGECDKDESFAEIRYVHELQHTLRLCGIEKEIVL